MKRHPVLFVCLLSLGCWLAACKTTRQPETAPGDWEVLGKEALAASRGKIDFVTHVKPVIGAKCVACHNRKTLPFFSLENRTLAFASPSRFVPGHPENSTFIINGTLTHAKTMPPVGNRLTQNEKRVLTDWVKQGASWPAGKAGEISVRD